jgi:predicted Zn-ribbon and HTH transcriptional regulator
MRVVTKEDRNYLEPWCRACKSFYWHKDDCELVQPRSGCPTCGSDVISAEDFDKIMAAMKDPSPPTPALVKLFRGQK